MRVVELTVLVLSLRNLFCCCECLASVLQVWGVVSRAAGLCGEAGLRCASDVAGLEA